MAVIIGDIIPYTQAIAILNQTVFMTNWTANVFSDVVVYQTPFGQDPDDVTQILAFPVDYSVIFVGAEQQVQVTLVTPAGAGDIITIIRDTPADRVNLYSNTNFTPNMLNTDFGILTLVDQQAQLVNQLIGPRYNYSAVITDVVDTILPILEANTVWMMNAQRTAIIATEISQGGGSVNPGLENELAYYASDGDVISGLPTANNGILITSAGGVPSISSTLPIAVQANITQLGAQSQALNMNTHLINNVVDPVSSQDAATKNYVDQIALNGTSVYAATTTGLTVTQAGSGVGATLTNAGAQATFALDGVNPPLNSNVLIKNFGAGMTAANEGIYAVTNVGSGATNWILTRATTYDTPTKINNTGLIVVQNGSTLSGSVWYNIATIITVDTTNFNYNQFGGFNFPITLAQGGTGAGLIASNGGIFYSNASTAAILSGTATAGLALLSGSNAAPTWSTLPPITKVVTQKFTVSGTYIPTAGMKYCYIQCQGAGGGGGGIGNPPPGNFSVGSGGGSGALSVGQFTAATIGGSQAITIGVGGTAGIAGGGIGGIGGQSSVGSLITAPGGFGGTFINNVTGSCIVGGLGGAEGAGGDIHIPGNCGVNGLTAATTGAIFGQAGSGANSYFGGGGQGPSGAGAGAPGRGFGSGGSGAVSNSLFGAFPGGPGGPGIIYITEYCSV